MQSFMRNPSDSFDKKMSKFDLYLRAREIDQIHQILETVLQKTKSEQKFWLDENQDVILDMLDSFMIDSVSILDGVRLDSESMQMSIKLMEKLKSTMRMMQTFQPSDSSQKN